eukprot:1184915-Prorocentrum_minimum.AAC.3
MSSQLLQSCRSRTCVRVVLRGGSTVRARPLQLADLHQSGAVQVGRLGAIPPAPPLLRFGRTLGGLGGPPPAARPVDPHLVHVVQIRQQGVHLVG